MYKLLVIDDQIKTENRNTIYKFMFEGAFDIKCIDSEEDSILKVLNNEFFDCVILDNNLNTGLEKEAVLDILSHFKCPVILVSNVREFKMNTYDQKGVIDYISLKGYFNLRTLKEDVKQGGDLQQFVEQILKDLHERINCDIYKARNYNNIDPNKLTICHVSDIQFCDPHADSDSLENLFSKMEDFIIRRDTAIDVLVISGDIVFSGKQNEYKKAYDLINKFQENLCKKKKKIVIFMVPGNHDFDYQCYLSSEDRTKCLLEKKVAQELYGKLKGKIADAADDLDNILASFNGFLITPEFFKDFYADSHYLSNFREFSYLITGDHQYLKSYFYVILSKYLKRGWKFVGINNAFRYHKNQNGGKRYSFEVNNTEVEKEEGDVYSIAVGHIDPRSLGYKTICEVKADRCDDSRYRVECQSRRQCEKWGDMQRFFLYTNSIIYLYGHQHCSDIEISDDKKLLFIGAASPTGINPSEKTINVVEIDNGDNSFKVQVAVHRAMSEGISYAHTEVYIYDKKRHEWEQVDN